MSIQLILIGIGMWLFIEGRMAEYLARMPGREIALAGIGSAAIGAIFIVIAVRFC